MILFSPFTFVFLSCGREDNKKYVVDGGSKVVPPLINISDGDANTS